MALRRLRQYCVCGEEFAFFFFLVYSFFWRTIILKDYILCAFLCAQLCRHSSQTYPKASLCYGVWCTHGIRMRLWRERNCHSSLKITHHKLTKTSTDTLLKIFIDVILSYALLAYTSEMSQIIEEIHLWSFILLEKSIC